MNKKLIVIVSSLFGLIFLLVIGIVIFIYLFTKTPEGINVTINGKPNISVDENFQITVEIENTTDKERTLDSIDIGDTYLAGIQIHDSNPSTKEVIDSADIKIIEPFVTYSFVKKIEPNSKETITFNATAVSIGDFDGSIDVCVDGMANCIYNKIRTIVR
jgi:hypothetical protein